ncbi:related to SYG1 protein [Cephalotrichum gorgonifer]|uniref:Related to SYG1 protein n=1 Tax=Cephalotrichum gorgonifer TaxID=2041049 RepID=A0AAE8T084_9PEZI|nr:related to SYG1 protein [Cephalotrichum gorgonifer]
MKFAKQLEQDLVPEWKAKYLNYKVGKKHVKAVSKAIQRAANTPHSINRPPTTQPAANDDAFGPASPHRPSAAQPIPVAQSCENDRLTGGGSSDLQYGSFALTPPALPTDENQFELPGPALRDRSASSTTGPSAGRRWSRHMRNLTGGAAWDSPAAPTPPSGAAPSATPPPHPLQRLFSTPSIRMHNSRSQVDISMQSLDLVRERQQEFFGFLDGELEKVEKFYRSKEDQAGKRLEVLREQLHEMRNRRIQEMADARNRRGTNKADTEDDDGRGAGEGLLGDGPRWMHPLKSKVFSNPGPNTKAFLKMAPTPVMAAANYASNNNNPGASTSASDAHRDFIRRPENTAIPYRTAKHKLKLALQEFYRSLELLKSYALLNRTAFRKLNKKYDKAVRARPPYRYLNDRVNKAYFVTSDVLDGYIQTVEDLYARYFEKNNRKVAVGKLRSLAGRRGDNSSSAFRSGVLIGTGLVFALQGLAFAVRLLYSDDAETRSRTSYLLQLYGGYFLMLYLFALFCVDCRFWRRSKINYPFIFELDPRHHLDWKQLAEFPSFFTFVLGLIMWLNFSQYGSEEFYIYYPVVLIAISAAVIFLPAPIFRSRSRSWFAYSHWRLLLAGFYPVEFRDFFLGDMYCSLTYATCNIELFFCLYANAWENPSQCNSTNSRLLGFFAALPPIWRFLQCLRRYRDTRNVFPHLVNGGKYTMSIVAAVTLSLYRISPSPATLGAFIAFSTINAIYCSIWDLFMDFSLLQPRSPYPFLRPITALKSNLIYYVIMVIDPILRFSWIGLAIFTHSKQHSTIVSFAIGALEVTRRGAWALVRVENEHCANVGAYKASRDVPLPYVFEEVEDASPICLEEEDGSGTGLGKVDTGRSFSRILAHAHTQDFEKKKRVQDDLVREEDEDEAEGSDIGEGSGGISEDEGVKLP